ncbi:MAG TPA: HAMP domain-containing sensor histidine kinase [Polyangiaceae bacterium]
MPPLDEQAKERLAVVGEIAAEVAHELRNVLQVISASAYVARQEAARGDAAATVPHVSKIEKNARIAHAIVDDLMALARGETLHSEPVLLAEVVVSARADLPDGAADWVDALDPTDLRVRAHPGLLGRLLHVLYDNAVQASAPRAPRIATSARGDSGRVVIEVSDDGPGVPPEIADRVFEPLVTARPGGTGLGLALARRIATAHGGTIDLGNGPGACFRIELPGA